MFYFNSDDPTSDLLEITTDGARQIIALNKKGEIPESFDEFKADKIVIETNFEDAMAEDNINRFDNKNSKKKRKQLKRKRNFKKNKTKANQRIKSQKNITKKDA